MNAKQELAGRIMMIAHDEIKPDPQQILDILAEYRIDHGTGIEEMDFVRQINHFLNAKKSEGHSPASTYNYRLYLLMFADYINKAAADVTANDIRDFITYLSETRNLKTSSIQSILNILRSFFTWMNVEELIPKNPTTRVRNFRINKKDSRHPLTQKQLEMLRNACQTYREKALVEFLYSTGCRVSEAVQIDVDAIDFEQRSVDVIGKGNKKRTLYFSVRAWLMMRQYISERKGGTALFCCTRRPYDRLGIRSVQILIRDLGRRAGISRHVHPHVLRHTLATNLLNSGMDITIIQQILGHGTVATTEIYAEISQDQPRSGEAGAGEIHSIMSDVTLTKQNS